MTLFYGLITGILFGVLMQKSLVLRYDKQLGALRLLDMTVIKFMLSAVLVAMVGIYLLKDLGMAELSPKPLTLGGNIIGGILFGVGWAMFGYCPGTSVGALAEGRWDALWGILGMLAGAAFFAEVFPWVDRTLMAIGRYGKITFPEILSIHHWLIIPPLVLGGVALGWWFVKKGL